jgi:hypothetical protein
MIFMTQYNPEQYRVIEGIKTTISGLRKLEALQQRMFRCPALGLNDAIDQAEADLALDNLPSYSALESRLRNQITDARSMGLGKDPYIVKVSEVAFS